MSMQCELLHCIFPLIKLCLQGPFRPNKDMSLSFNEYAWNTVANMVTELILIKLQRYSFSYINSIEFCICVGQVFIESPCGVGYSYSTAEDTTEDYKMDDEETAADNYELIQVPFNVL